MRSPSLKLAATALTSLALAVAATPALAADLDVGGYKIVRHGCALGPCGSPPAPCSGLPATSRCYAYTVAHTQICRRFVPTFDDLGACLGWRAIFVC
jgi:hypothetical protein